jgi:hypothetical protein
LRALPLAAFHDAAAPPAVVFVPIDYSRIPGAAQLRTLFRGARVLWLPLASFASDFESAAYSISLLLQSDFEQAVSRNRSLISLLLTTRDSLEFTSDGHRLRCALDDEIYVASRTRVGLAEGEHASVGAYCEVGLHTAIGEFDPPFDVSGELRVDGMIVARHRESPSALDETFASARELVEDLSSDLPFSLIVEDNHVREDCLGGAEALLREVTNPEYDLLLNEVAFGTNHALAGHVDWRINSQLNEGVGGMHVAVGDGLTGAHIDFVCQEGTIEPLAE